MSMAVPNCDGKEMAPHWLHTRTFPWHLDAHGYVQGHTKGSRIRFQFVSCLKTDVDRTKMAVFTSFHDFYEPVLLVLALRLSFLTLEPL